eukprot:10374704-Alexandrium_andersonii.AAC.1
MSRPQNRTEPTRGCSRPLQWKAPNSAWNGLRQAAGDHFRRCSALSTAFRRCPAVLFRRTAPEPAW